MSRASRRQAWTEHLAHGKDQPGAARAPSPQRKASPTDRADLEFQIQSGFINWVRIVEVQQYPELQLLYAIPNGGNRHPATGAKMKREGVKRGIPDLHLPVARNGHHSLYLETKAPGGTLSQWQRQVKAQLETEGNRVQVCHSIDGLIAAVLTYLGYPLR